MWGVAPRTRAISVPVGVVDDLRGDGRGWIIVAVAFGWLLALGMRLVVPALLPGITAEFRINNTTAGFAITLLWIAYASVQFPSGLLTDRIGERGVLLWSVVLGTVGILLFSVAPVFTIFLVACVIFGLGTGLYGTPRVTVLSKTYPRKDGTAIGVTFSAGNVGAAVLPFAAGVIGLQLGWRAGFAFAIPLFLVVLVALWRVAPRPTGREPTRLEAGSIRRMVAGIRQRPVLLMSGATTINVFTFQGFTSFLPLYLVIAKGLGPGVAAALYGLFFVVGAVIQPIAGASADRYGDRVVLLALAGVTALMLFTLPFVEGLGPLVAVIVLLGLRAGVAPLNSAYIASSLPHDVQGSGLGLLRTVFLGVGSTASIAVGVLADADLFDAAFLLLGGLVAITVGLYALLPPRRPITAAEPNDSPPSGA